MCVDDDFDSTSFKKLDVMFEYVICKDQLFNSITKVTSGFMFMDYVTQSLIKEHITLSTTCVYRMYTQLVPNTSMCPKYDQ